MICSTVTPWSAAMLLMLSPRRTVCELEWAAVDGGSAPSPPEVPPELPVDPDPETTRLWPIRIRLGLAMAFLSTRADTVDPYLKAILPRVSPRATMWITSGSPS